MYTLPRIPTVIIIKDFKVLTDVQYNIVPVKTFCNKNFNNNE